ncbi:SMN protein Smn1 [Homalodisca vitripennis]|nr:SMN protein Smn1 [Homalodisca vitripennis]
MAKMKAEASSEEANLFIHKKGAKEPRTIFATPPSTVCRFTCFNQQEPAVEESEDDDDVWDDAQLVKAYDRAIYKAKQQILDKIQKEMSLTEADIQDVLGDPPTPKKRKKRKNKSNTGGNYPMWKVGSACRAIWSEDGEEYECEIVEMIDGNWCTRSPPVKIYVEKCMTLISSHVPSEEGEASFEPASPDKAGRGWHSLMSRLARTFDTRFNPLRFVLF